jgi:amino acid permease
MGGDSEESTSSSSGGNGTIFSTISVLFANLVGAGILSLPYIFSQAGLIPSIILMIFMCAMSITSAVVIARCAEMSNSFVYRDIATKAFGSTGGVLVSALMSLYCLGSCISFVVLLSDFFPQLICENGCNTPVAIFFSSRVNIMLLVGTFLIFPLSIMRNLSSLKYTSVLSFVCILYTSLMIASKAAMGPVEPIDLITNSRGVFLFLPIAAISFTLHYNVPRYYYELKARTLYKFTLIAILAFTLVMILYLFTAISGYLLFGANTDGDILSNFSDSDILALIARVALSCVILACYPLAFHSYRSNFVELLPMWMQVSLKKASMQNLSCSKKRYLNGKEYSLGNSSSSESISIDNGIMSPSATSPQSTNTASTGLDLPLLGGSSSKKPVQLQFYSIFMDWPHYVLCALLVAVSIVVGLAVPKIEVVLGYKGSLGGSLVVYIIPGCMHYVLVQQSRLYKATKEDESADHLIESSKVPIWNIRDLLTTSHGLFCIYFSAIGFLVMILGTLTTSGAI